MPVSAPIRPELLNALSLLLPGEVETALLRACLWSGEPGRSAWASFRAAVPDPVEFFRGDTVGIRRLGPLLLHALADHGGDADPELVTALRLARLREELRTAEYQRICGAASDVLYAARVPFILLKGAALGPAVYEDPVLRHAHDIDLLVRERDLEAANTALAAAGFVGGPRGAVEKGISPVEWFHPSLLPLLLHTRLFRLELFRDPGQSLWDRAETRGGTRVLSPGDALLHTLGEAACSLRRASLAWVTDAYLTIDRRADLDWEVFIEAAVRGRLVLPAFVMLNFLAEVLSARVPSAVLSQLNQACGRASRLERDLALFHARQGRSLEDAFAALRKLGWRTRLYWVRTLLLPSAAYLRWSFGGQRAVLLPLHYLRRPARYLWEWAGRRLLRQAAG